MKPVRFRSCVILLKNHFDCANPQSKSALEVLHLDHGTSILDQYLYDKACLGVFLRFSVFL